MRVVAWSAAARLWAACAAIFLVSCSQAPRSALDGVLVFEGPLQLERGKDSDTVTREFSADADATFVFVAVEDDLDFRARLERLDTPHVLVLGEDRWTIEHSLGCRESGRMAECVLHERVAEWIDKVGEPDLPKGRYRIDGEQVPESLVALPGSGE